MVLSAAMIVVVASYFVGRGEVSDVLVATVAIIVFILAVCAARPLRPLEHQLILAMIPQDWKVVRVFADAITRH